MTETPFEAMQREIREAKKRGQPDKLKVIMRDLRVLTQEATAAAESFQLAKIPK